MYNRIQELETKYNQIEEQKRFLSTASVYNPQASGVLSETYKFLDELHTQVFQEIQDLKQEYQTLQYLLKGITKHPNSTTEKAMEEDINNESHDSVEDMFSQILSNKKENHDLRLQEEIKGLMQTEANRTGEKVSYEIHTAGMSFGGRVVPQTKSAKEQL